MINKNYLISLIFLICVNVVNNIKCMKDEKKCNQLFNIIIKNLNYYSIYFNSRVLQKYNNTASIFGTRVTGPQIISKENFEQGNYNNEQSFIIADSSSRWQGLDNNNNNNNDGYPNFDISCSNNNYYFENNNNNNNQNSLEKYKDDQNEQKNKQFKALMDFINKNPNAKITYNNDHKFFAFESFCAKLTFFKESLIYNDLQIFYNSMLKNQLPLENNNQIDLQKNSSKFNNNNSFFIKSISLGCLQKKCIEHMYKEINDNDNNNNNKLALPQPPILVLQKQKNSTINDLLGFIPVTEEKNI